MTLSEIFDPEPVSLSPATVRRELIAQIDYCNAELDKIMQATGLELMPFIVEEDGYRGFDLFGKVGEVRGLTHGNYTVKFAEIKHFEDHYRRINTTRIDSIQAYEQRKLLLEHFQKVWTKADISLPGISVYFGLSKVILRISLRLMLQYQLYLRKQFWDDRFTQCSVLVDTEKLGFQFFWTERDLEIFHDFVDILSWQITKADKLNPPEQALRDFQYHKSQFWEWEQRTFQT